jgi:hypothetical protein
MALASLVLASLFMMPLACGSFMFFHAAKWTLNHLRQARDRQQESLNWHTLSETLGQRLALPYIMVTGPRWNPHALISHVGPFPVENSLRIRADTAHQAALMWTLIINRAADLRTMAVIDSSHVAQNDAWYEQSLPAGRYLAVLRYYEWSATPRLPEIAIDNKRLIPERSVPSNDNDYLSGLRNKDGIFYASLHYYVLAMLRLRQYLPASFVRREYLPVGNPETAFNYGYLRRGQCLEITSSHGIPDGHRLYLTIYNRSSFPISWSEISSLPYRTSAIEATGSYLWRLHAMRSRETPPVWPEHLQVSLC